MKHRDNLTCRSGGYPKGKTGKVTTSKMEVKAQANTNRLRYPPPEGGIEYINMRLLMDSIYHTATVLRYSCSPIFLHAYLSIYLSTYIFIYLYISLYK